MVLDNKVYVFVVNENGVTVHTAVLRDEKEAELYVTLYLRETFPEEVAIITDFLDLPVDSFQDLAANWPDDSDVDWELYEEIVFDTSAELRHWWQVAEQEDANS
jgi:hypothetical protein